MNGGVVGQAAMERLSRGMAVEDNERTAGGGRLWSCEKAEIKDNDDQAAAAAAGDAAHLKG